MAKAKVELIEQDDLESDTEQQDIDKVELVAAEIMADMEELYRLMARFRALWLSMDEDFPIDELDALSAEIAAKQADIENRARARKEKHKESWERIASIAGRDALAIN